MEQQSPDKNTPGARELKKQRNRAAILLAGREIFSTIGYDAATVRDIVRESGLSPGTFYNYFEDKDAVFRDVIAEVVDQLRQRLRLARKNAVTGHQFLHQAFLTYFQLFSEHPQLMALVERNQAAVRHLVGEGHIVSELYTELAADVVQAMDEGMMPRIPVGSLIIVMHGAGFEFLAQMSQNPSLKAEEISLFLADLFCGGMKQVAETRAKNKTAPEM
ncbi:TetR family transcriptional regulator [Acanthopleuribacter pedis]|uniref:TetR/AcrR family transcriptional regulator n=1 Tax=Acanthopleuribacter pedis TaxID=442870 RepID=A0A8J7QHD1_9BACT|nr:TetR/AcrR family transcriptional regulator [Acanthopleuribacter pedis]